MARKIVTDYWRKPVPTNKFDWTCHFDGEEEYGGYGYGATEAEAIADFYENWAEIHLERLGEAEEGSATLAIVKNALEGRRA